MRAVGVAVLLLLAVTAPAAAAPPPIAQSLLESMDPTSTNLSWGEGGATPLTAWSYRAADGTGRLEVVGPPPSQVWVTGPRPSNSLFDPDVEARNAWHPSVVYTRCAGLSGLNCDVYRFSNLGERKVHGASSARCSEFAPSIWTRRVVFGRSGPRGCRGLYIARRDGTVKKLDRRVPADTDVFGGRAADLYIPAANASRTEIREVPTRGGRSRLIATGFAGPGSGTRVTNPDIVDNWIYWLHEDVRRKLFVVGRTPARGRLVPEFSTSMLPGKVDSIAVEAANGPGLPPPVWYTNGGGVYRASGLPFAAQ